MKNLLGQKILSRVLKIGLTVTAPREKNYTNGNVFQLKLCGQVSLYTEYLLHKRIEETSKLI